MSHRTLVFSAAATLVLVSLAVPAGAQSSRVELDPEMPFALERVIEIGVAAPGVLIVTGDGMIREADTLGGPLVHFGGRSYSRGA